MIVKKLRLKDEFAFLGENSAKRFGALLPCDKRRIGQVPQGKL